MDHVSSQLDELSIHMETALEKAISDKAGKPIKILEYPLQDVSGKALITEWSQNDFITIDDIQGTSGYKSLSDKAGFLGLKLRLVEEEDDILAESDRKTYKIRIYGWAE